MGKRKLRDNVSCNDIGCPDAWQVVQTPQVTRFTEDLFAAIEAFNVHQVHALLEMGQDPNCVMIGSAFHEAVEGGSVPIVELLIKGNAS